MVKDAEFSWNHKNKVLLLSMNLIMANLLKICNWHARQNKESVFG
jgi:hypothetical protein